MGLIDATVKWLLGSGEEMRGVSAGIRERRHEMRIAVADKHERNGKRLVDLGERAGDQVLIEEGRDYLRRAQALRAGEVTLLSALGIDEDMEEPDWTEESDGTGNAEGDGGLDGDANS